MNAIVTACVSPAPVSPYQRNPTRNATSVHAANRTPCHAINHANDRVMSGACGSRGGRSITSSPAGSIASASAGNRSVTMFNQRICNTAIGSGQPSMMAAKTVMISAKLQAKR